MVVRVWPISPGSRWAIDLLWTCPVQIGYQGWCVVHEYWEDQGIIFDRTPRYEAASFSSCSSHTVEGTGSKFMGAIHKVFVNARVECGMLNVARPYVRDIPWNSPWCNNGLLSSYTMLLYINFRHLIRQSFQLGTLTYAHMLSIVNVMINLIWQRKQKLRGCVISGASLYSNYISNANNLVSLWLSTIR